MIEEHNEAADRPENAPSGQSGPQAFSELPLLLTVPEVATLLRKTNAAIYSMKKKGELPGVVLVGKRGFRVRRDALIKWLSEVRVPSSRRSGR